MTRRENSAVVKEFDIKRYSVKLRLFKEDGGNKPRWKVTLTIRRRFNSAFAFLHRRREDSAIKAYDELVGLVTAVAIGAAPAVELYNVMQAMNDETWRPNRKWGQ